MLLDRHSNGTRHPAFAERERIYRALLPLELRPRRVLDVGGVWASSAFLADRFPGASLAVLNLSYRAVAEIAPPAGRAAGDAERLPFRDGAFDLVFAGELLEHLVHPAAFLEEASRVLRAGGLLALSTPNLASWHNRLLLAFGYSPSNYSLVPDRHLGVPRALRARAGLGYHDHVRVFTYRALRELLSTPPWCLRTIAARNCWSAGRPAGHLRAALNVLPPSAREDLFACAVNEK